MTAMKDWKIDCDDQWASWPDHHSYLRFYFSIDATVAWGYDDDDFGRSIVKSYAMPENWCFS